MMDRKRMMKISLWVFLVLLFSLSYKVHTCAEEADTELLVVIDGSGSMSEEEKDIRKLLKLLYQWIEEEAHFQNVRYIVFQEEAAEVDYEHVMDMGFSGDTCISKGLELADGIVEKAVDKGRSLGVLVVSDMLASVRMGKDDAWEKAKEEQKAVSKVFAEWDKYCADGKMSYLVLTWKNKQRMSLSEIEKEYGKNASSAIKDMEEFCCIFQGNKDRIHFIQQNKDNTSGSVLSQAQLVGNTIIKLLQSLNGVKIENSSYIFTSKDKNLALQDFCEAYVVTTGNNTLYLMDNGEKRKIDTFQEMDDIRIYHIDVVYKESTYCMSPETSDYDCYLFYIQKKGPLAMCVDQHPIAGKEFQVSCEIEEEYLCKLLPKPLRAVIYHKENGNEESIGEVEMQEEKEGDFKASMCLEESTYNIQIRTNDGQLLDEIECQVYKDVTSTSMPTSPPTPEPKPETHSGILIGVCGFVGVIVLIFLAGFVLYKMRKGR